MSQETAVPSDTNYKELPREFAHTDVPVPPAPPQMPFQPQQQQPAPPVNPLLEKARIPGETHRLPSHGIFYNNGEIENMEDGEVHIYPMNAYDEILLSSPAKIFSGDAIMEVIQRCIPNVRKPRELLAQDIDFILLCLRKISYGPTFDFQKEHDDCPATEEMNKQLREAGEPERGPRSHPYQANMSALVASTTEIDETALNNQYRIELTNGQIVKTQPLRFDEYLKLMQFSTKKVSDVTEEDQIKIILVQLEGIIASVDGISDKSMIREWLNAITPQIVRELTAGIDKMAKWGVNTKVEFKCRDCGADMEVDLPTNPLVLFS